jgi:glycosyltransferase involved in cell wall biosynthesis/nucleoside-diphosphate-sugar epimerase
MQRLKLKNKTICITGASGIIGKALIDRLVKYDCNINILSRKKLSNFIFSKKIKIFQGDLSNPILDLQPFLKNSDYIINCAAELQNIDLMSQVNTQSIFRLITAINKNFKLKKKKVHLIQLSSCGVYGSLNLWNIKKKRAVFEFTEPNPSNYYEKTKLEADKAIISLSKKYPINYTVLRPSNVISEKMKHNIFLSLNKYIRFFFIKPSSNTIASYVHIDDVINSIIAIIFNNKSRNKIFNLSLKSEWIEILDKLANLNQIKLFNFSINSRLLIFSLLILKFFFKFFFNVPLFGNFYSRTIYSSRKIEEILNFKFQNPLPDKIEKFLFKTTNIKKKIILSKKNKNKLNFKKLDNITVRANNNVAVSVIMSVYNSEKYLKDSIKSILSQTFKNFEFIIINDGSTDSSLKIIQNFAKRDNRIKIINKSNTGLTHSLNCGIHIAKGEWIARIDADDTARNDRLMKQYLMGSADDTLVLIGSACWEINKFGKKIKYFEYPENHNQLRNNLLHMKKFFPHSSYFLKTRLVKKINGYNLKMIRSQDYDLSLRLCDFGRFFCIAEPLINLRKHDDSISNTDLKNNGLIYPRLSLVSYYLNKINFPNPLKKNISKENFLNFYKVIKDDYDKKQSLILSKILKILIKKNRYDYYSNQMFANFQNNIIFEEWLKILFKAK